MILGTRFDPAPFAAALLTLPEPRVALEVVHHEIDRIDGAAAMAGAGGHQHDRLAWAHLAHAVDDQDAHQAEPRQRLVGERVHAGQGQRFVMRKLERRDIVVAAHFADESANAAEPRMRVGERADQRAGDERLREQAPVLRHVSRR